MAPQHRAWALRAPCRWLGAVAPRLLGRLAADAFSYTRSRHTPTRDVPPPGAQRFEIYGAPGVEHGYLWRRRGPGALLVHDWGADSSSMRGFVRPLQQLGFRVASFDAPAHGIWPGNTTTLRDFSASVEAAITSLGGVSVVIAHSVGCIAAVAALARAGGLPEPTRCLVLLAPAASWRRVIDTWAAGPAAVPPKVLQEMLRELQRREGLPLHHWDVVALGRQLWAPTLVLHDPADPDVAFCQAQQISRCFVSARLQPVPGLGHHRLLGSAHVRSEVARFVAVHARLLPSLPPGMPALRQ
ncbi:alpha/beta fold hydrolase [Caldimonas brevitalea]|nr:alpha/beta fold hydrolase [Caldimonas brevitalea]